MICAVTRLGKLVADGVSSLFIGKNKLSNSALMNKNMISDSCLEVPQCASLSNGFNVPLLACLRSGTGCLQGSADLRCVSWLEKDERLAGQGRQRRVAVIPKIAGMTDVHNSLISGRTSSQSLHIYDARARTLQYLLMWSRLLASLHSG